MDEPVAIHLPEIDDDRIQQLQLHWSAANYLSAAQLYLKENVWVKDPLRKSHLKPRLLGHWGTVPGLNFIYSHLNRLIQDTDANLLLVTGPGHGAPAIVSNLYMEGTLGTFYPEMVHSADGFTTVVQSFSWPYQIPSHLNAGTPGQIHEGGELGYSLSHAFGAAFDNPDLIVPCIVGDGEAETGPLATAWHSNKFLNPVHDGAVLPILHLNGYKIAGPTFLARLNPQTLEQLFNGYGYEVFWVEGSDHEAMHRDMWETLNRAYLKIREIQKEAREDRIKSLPQWPMIILKSPKGWTGPKEIDGKAIENTFRAHQIPVDGFDNEDHLQVLSEWLNSYQPQQLFDEQGKPNEKVLAMCPDGAKRMGMNAHANGGSLSQALDLPDLSEYAAEVSSPGKQKEKSTQMVGSYLGEVMKRSARERNFRIFCPDELSSNKLQNVLEVTDRTWMASTQEQDDHLAVDGRVMEVLSEHNCEGWIEGYLLTGRHGLFACYEAFIPIIDSMMNQFAKWLKVSQETPWRAPIPSLNYLLTSHVWRQDHNGYSHQVPSFINNLVIKKNSVARVYLPPDANCTLNITDHCLKNKGHINLIVANKSTQPQWLTIEEAREHCKKGASVWEWAGNAREEPDIILAAAGDVPTLETVRAAELIMAKAAEVKVRMINVVDLFSLMDAQEHSHGLYQSSFNEMFTIDKEVIFAFHGYPNLIHELVHHRANPERFHVHGYQEEGSTTTPFDMLVVNKISRYHLVLAALERVEKETKNTAALQLYCLHKLAEHQRYIKLHGEDMPEILQDL